MAVKMAGIDMKKNYVTVTLCTYTAIRNENVPKIIINSTVN